MVDYGTGTGTPVNPTVSSGEVSGGNAVSLARYAEIIGYTQCAFFGVAHPDNAQFACRQIWTRDQRVAVEYYLALAQSEIENVLGYAISPKWYTDEQHYIRTNRQNAPVFSAHLKHVNLIKMGVTKVESIKEDALVAIGEPCAISFPTTLLTDVKDLHVYYPNTEVEIRPSSIEYVNDVLTIKFQKCHLVKFELLNNPDQGLDYSLDSNFQSMVDVRRITTDEGSIGNLIWIPGSTCTEEFAENQVSVNAYIVNKETGYVQFYPATFSDGHWVRNKSCLTSNPDMVRLSYQAGLQSLSRELEDAVVRLAHSRMPSEPCGCDITQRLWQRDRTIPQIITTERVTCPFGVSDGAWAAWTLVQSSKFIRMSSL